MKKTLLLCFIHGFKGGEDTFGHNYQFTEDLRQRLSVALPKIDIRVVVYPKFETRGDLVDCVSRFRDWLLEKVIDIEVEAQTPSPTVDPSVRTILVGHSMGGIVAAETVIALTSDKPIPPPSSTDPDASTTGAPADSASASLNSLMFPYIQGVLAFDTPYLGISPGVVAHGAEGHYTKASEALTQLSGLTGALWGGSAGAASSSSSRQQQGGAARKEPVAALPAPPPPQQQQVNNQQQKQAGGGGGGGGWGSWGKIAMYAGAGAALAGGAAAAYLKRDQITEGWTWAASHLEFVGCLARGEELRRRTAYMVRANRELGLGFANLYTRLGKAAPPKQVSMVGTVMGSQRTFCNLPSRQAAGDWREAVNDAASDETWAHMSMFDPKENPGYERLADEARDLIASWARNDWYEASSEEEKPGILA